MARIETNAKAFGKALKGSVKSALPQPLTAMVKEAKKAAPGQISRDMTLRSKGFISSSIRYQGAASGRLVASWGMRPRERFTGLAEQEFGRTDTNDRAPTLKSRGGNLARRVAPRRRLKSSTKVLSAKDLQRKPKSDVEMLAVLRRSKYKGLFIMTVAKSIRPGIYRFVGGKKGKLELIHALGDLPQQRKRPWMDHTNDRIMKDDIGQEAWAQSMSRFLSDRVRRLTK